MTKRKQACHSKHWCWRVDEIGLCSLVTLWLGRLAETEYEMPLTGGLPEDVAKFVQGLHMSTDVVQDRVIHQWKLVPAPFPSPSL